MRFNLLLVDESIDRLQELEDFVRPVLFGLRAAGHLVGVSRHGLKPPPAVNLAVDALVGPDLLESVGSSRASFGSDLLFGILCTASFDALTATHRDLLNAAVAASDFIWVAEGLRAPPTMVKLGRMAELVYGFDEALLGQNLITDPALRDTDVVIYARETAQSNALVARIGGVGLSHFIVQPGALPDYLTSDLLSRGKVAVVLGDGGPSSVAPRVVKAILNGVAVITGPRAAGKAGAAAGVLELPDEEMADRCLAVVRDGNYVRLGQTALDALRGAATMRDTIAAALRLPAFARAGGA